MSNWEGWPEDEQLRNLLLRFFLDFARFEYAMKTSGFGTNKRKYFEPDYDNFKSFMKKQAFPEIIKEEHQYLWDSPPQRQASADKWEDITTTEGWAFIIECIKTVRNNLFHGGKYPFDVDRDVQLICHCSVALRTLVESTSDDFRRQFRGAL